MKKLDIQKIIMVSSDVAISKYKGLYLDSVHQNILLSAQNEKQQAIIEEVFKKAPDAFPAEYVIEEKEKKTNGINNK